MSIEHSIQHPEEALEFAKAWGRGIDDETNQKFVTMYVNERTIDYSLKVAHPFDVFSKKVKNSIVRDDFDVSSLTFIVQRSDKYPTVSDTSEYGSVDPAPPSDSEQLNELKDILLDEHQKSLNVCVLCLLRNIRSSESCMIL